MREIKTKRTSREFVQPDRALRGRAACKKGGDSVQVCYLLFIQSAISQQVKMRHRREKETATIDTPSATATIFPRAVSASMTPPGECRRGRRDSR